MEGAPPDPTRVPPRPSEPGKDLRRFFVKPSVPPAGNRVLGNRSRRKSLYSETKFNRDPNVSLKRPEKGTFSHPDSEYPPPKLPGGPRRGIREGVVMSRTRVLLIVLAIAFGGSRADASPISHFTWAFTDNYYFFSDAVFRTNGQASSTSRLGFNAHAVAEGSGSADLSDGTLKALAHVRADTGDYESGDVETYVGFGDSFRTQTSTGAAFDWTGSYATMSVDISGFRSSAGVSPYNTGWVGMCVLPAGGLDAIATRSAAKTEFTMRIWTAVRSSRPTSWGPATESSQGS